mmetsp:Transcript_16651/g.31203  ORF Transcript_16651/g.31203 Transcript_16651/m.31203 type:complete len:645 (+) Transcript_16651:151-2085(+)
MIAASYTSLWLCLVTVLQLCPALSKLGGLSSVQLHHSRDEGVVITSFRFRSVVAPQVTNSSLNPPLWVTNYLKPQPTGGDSDMGKPRLQCYIEMLGFMEFPRRSKVGNIHGVAQLMHADWGTEGVKCRYRNTFTRAASEGKYVPLVYYCEVDAVELCGQIAAPSTRSSNNSAFARHTSLDLKTVRDGVVYRSAVIARVRTERKVPVNVSFFDSAQHADRAVAARSSRSSTVPDTSRSGRKKTSIISRVRQMLFHRRQSPAYSSSTTTADTVTTADSISSVSPNNNISAAAGVTASGAEVAVCLVLPYNTHELMQKTILVENIRWYQDVLGFRVMIFDSNGAHRKFLAHNGVFTSSQLLRDYHDYTVFNILGHGIRMTQYILDTDFDKILTLTHCRMEARALYDIESVLVVDSDEFLYCQDDSKRVSYRFKSTSPQKPHTVEPARALRNYQHEAVQALLRAARAQEGGVDQIAFTRFSPMYARVEGSLTHTREGCMANTMLGGGASLFSCFASIAQRRGNYLPKSLMLNYACPHSSNHYSCTLNPLNVSKDKCRCSHVDIPPAQCFIIHVRVKALQPNKEVATASNGGLLLELDAIMRELPRPRAPVSKFNRTAHEAKMRAMIAASKKNNRSSTPRKKPRPLKNN